MTGLSPGELRARLRAVAARRACALWIDAARRVELVGHELRVVVAERFQRDYLASRLAEWAWAARLPVSAVEIVLAPPGMSVPVCTQSGAID